MTQAIKYERTEVEAERSVSQIAALVRRYGGSRFETLWDEEGEIRGIRFAIRAPGGLAGGEIEELPIYMTARTGEIERILLSSGYATGRTAEQKRERPKRVAAQARRIGWRHLKDLTEQLLLAVELGLRTLPGAFMADIEAYDGATGETVTMYELFERRAVPASRSDSRSRSGGSEDTSRGIELVTGEHRGSGGAIELPPVAAGD